MKTKSRFTLYYKRNRNRIVKAISLYEAEMMKGKFDSKLYFKEKKMTENILEGTDLAYCGHNLALFGSKLHTCNKDLPRPITVSEYKSLTEHQKLNFHKLEDLPFEAGNTPDWWRPVLEA